MKKYFLFWGFVLGVTHIFACQCIESGSVKEEFKEYNLVFTATVIEILGPIEPFDTTWIDVKMLIRKPVFGYSKKVLLQSIYKGKRLNDTLIIAGNQSNCELYLKVGDTYLIYGNLQNGEVITNACTRSGNVINHPDLVYLDKKKRKKKLKPAN